eukprot:15472484-Alexandrium_andersonii.AAC.1
MDPRVVAETLRNALPASETEYRATSLVRMSRSPEGVERIDADALELNYPMLEALLERYGERPLNSSAIADG